ncbi:MAG: hypothetical protein DLM54_08460 [Acidimicrobiales bacterium]|nr:MAG: hypothetical protein DLM54_08460 [Acidimicrobiales bacterium]
MEQRSSFARRSIASVASQPGAPRLLDSWPRQARWLAPSAFAVFVAVGLAIRLPHDAPVAVGAAVVAMAAAALLVEPAPRLVLVYAAVATGGIAVLGNGTSSNVGWFAVCMLSGWCGLVGSRRDGLVYWMAALALFGAEWLWVEPDPGWAAWIAGVSFTALGALLVRHELTLVAQLRAAQAGLAERARAEECNRIARELHDVIAHTLTVSLLHIASARLAIEHDPADAGRSLAEAERLGRESLTEVRSTVGMLHRDGSADDGVAGNGTTDDATAPLPGLEGWPALIERFRSAGADVVFTIEGETAGLPATIGLAVYRILQEALTNAVRHAPGAPIAAKLTVDSTSAVDLAIDSAGKPGHGRGLGMVSMRERAEALGGTC